MKDVMTTEGVSATGGPGRRRLGRRQVRVAMGVLGLAVAGLTAIAVAAWSAAGSSAAAQGGQRAVATVISVHVTSVSGRGGTQYTSHYLMSFETRTGQRIITTVLANADDPCSCTRTVVAYDPSRPNHAELVGPTSRSSCPAFSGPSARPYPTEPESARSDASCTSPGEGSRAPCSWSAPGEPLSHCSPPSATTTADRISTLPGAGEPILEKPSLVGPADRCVSESPCKRVTDRQGSPLPGDSGPDRDHPIGCSDGKAHHQVDLMINGVDEVPRSCPMRAVAGGTGYVRDACPIQRLLDRSLGGVDGHVPVPDGAREAKRCE